MSTRRLHWNLILVAVMSLALVGMAESRFEWRDVEQTVEIRADGSIVVDDVRTLWTDEDFGEAFVCIEHGPDISITLLDGAGAVSAGPDARAYQQSCESGAAGTELVVAQDSRVDERRVRFRYRLDGSLQAHEDVVQWYWQIYGQGNPPTLGYQLTVTTPGPMDAPYDAYVHRFGNPERPTVELSEDRDRLEVAFDRVPAGEGVEIRYLMPPALFELGGSGQRLETYLQDEARIAQIGVPGAPAVSVSGPPSVLPGTATIVGITRAGNAPVDHVTATLRSAATVECAGTHRYYCTFDDLERGLHWIDVLAVDAQERIGVETYVLSVEDQDDPEAALLNAAFTGDVASIRAQLMRGTDPNVRSVVGMTPLMRAAAFNSDENVLRALIDAGARVDARQRSGFTPLMFAASVGASPSALRILIDAGAEIDARNADGMTALMLAASAHPHPEAIRTLLDLGADATLHDEAGRRAIDYADLNADLKDSDAYWELADASF